MPCARHTSATFRPASPSLTITRICSSVNLLRFIGPPRNGGPHSTRGGLLGAGHIASDTAPVLVLQDLSFAGIGQILYLSLSLPFENCFRYSRVSVFPVTFPVVMARSSAPSSSMTKSRGTVALIGE